MSHKNKVFWGLLNTYRNQVLAQKVPWAIWMILEYLDDERILGSSVIILFIFFPQNLTIEGFTNNKISGCPGMFFFFFLSFLHSTQLFYPFSLIYTIWSHWLMTGEIMKNKKQKWIDKLECKIDENH